MGSRGWHPLATLIAGSDGRQRHAQHPLGENISRTHAHHGAGIKANPTPAACTETARYLNPNIVNTLANTQGTSG